jgi:hypothetical protein
MNWQDCLLHAVLALLSYVFLGMGALGSGAYLLLEKMPRAREIPELFSLAQRVRFSFNLFYFLTSLVLLLVSLWLGLTKSLTTWPSRFEAKVISSGFLALFLLTSALYLVFCMATHRKVEKRLAWILLIGFLLALANLTVGNFILGGQHDFL